MSFWDTQLDQETIDSTDEQINFYSNIPKHIRGIAKELKLIEYKTPVTETDYSFKPAHVVANMITVRSGKLNIPSLINP